MKHERSSALFAEARSVLVGGVNSPVRAFNSVGGNPLVVERAFGSRVVDVDGNEYIDYLASWGPMILGHAHPAVVEAVCRAAGRGTSYGATCEPEIELGRLVADAFPSIDLVRFVNSGTEAVISALRLARAWTKRNTIVKFAGCYHGHSDALLVEAGSGVMTLGIPGSAGVPAHVVQDTVVAPYNDVEAIREVFASFPDSIAAVVVEPIAGNMGVVPPKEGFLEELRTLTSRHGALLVFDEVITGFRCAYGGVQTLRKITPDLTCLGKIIGGGLPVGAYGGRREIMEMVAPLGPVYQAGTLSGNPLAMAAGIAALRALKAENPYARMETYARVLDEAFRIVAERKGMPMSVNRVGSMLTPFCTDTAVVDYETARTSDTGLYARLFWSVVDLGIFAPPSQFEAWFVSAAHTEDDITATVESIDNAIQRL